jgi:hypothetical protein
MRARSTQPPMLRTALSPWRVFVREERETKTAKSRQWQLNSPDDRWPLMFLKRFDRERELLKNHP